MYANFTCEHCFEEYASEDDFVRCHGDACHEDVCKATCSKKCKVPTCHRSICENCDQTLKGYCIDHHIWGEDGEHIDYIAKGQTFIEAMRDLDLSIEVQCSKTGCKKKVEITKSQSKQNFKALCARHNRSVKGWNV